MAFCPVHLTKFTDPSIHGYLAFASLELTWLFLSCRCLFLHGGWPVVLLPGRFSSRKLHSRIQCLQPLTDMVSFFPCRSHFLCDGRQAGVLSEVHGVLLSDERTFSLGLTRLYLSCRCLFLHGDWLALVLPDVSWKIY